MRAASELGIRTVAIYSHEDRFALHRFKADESYQVGAGKNPLQAYLDIEDVIRIAREAGVDAIHPGYGFLSENPEFATRVADEGITFIGPTPQVMTSLGNKVSARIAAQEAGVPVMPATDPLPKNIDDCLAKATEVGYPLMLKASWGGGGRGMRVIENEQDLTEQIDAARREADAAFGNDEVYLEKLVRNAHHVEVQILGDTHGNLIHLFERDCSVQRRNQKVVERAPAPYLNEEQRQSLCESALKLGRAVNYTHAGTVEFLMDADTSQYYFIEVNPRIQVEHTVTEAVTGVDIVKAQIRVSEGKKIGDDASGIPAQKDVRLNGHALQCRVTTEDPENNFTPDYGRVQAYRSASGFGVRLDAGTAYTGALITPYYDSLLVKVTAWAPESNEAIDRMDRCLREFRIRGVSSNLQFVENVINHDDFRTGSVTTRFIDQTPALFKFSRRRDRAQRLLRYIGNVTVNGHPDVKGRAEPDLEHIHLPLPQGVDLVEEPTPGTKTILDAMGPEKFASWMLAEKRTLLTDTSMRDAHQSLFATRMRTIDMLRVAPYYSRMLPGLFSLECWGGATFDVSMRFLNEDPWQRLRQLREAVPNIMLQMLLRSSNAVGYTNYADNVVKYFVEQAAKEGIDLFRVFDSLNWVENMRVAIDAVLDTGRLCEGAICYTGDILDQTRPKYSLRYYVDLGKQLQKAGVHVLAVKDMAGICRPQAAEVLVRNLKEETGLPVHFHTHDTSGIAAASVLGAIAGGADAVDGAMDSLSGLTSQPNLNSIVHALLGGDRDPTKIAGNTSPSGVDVDSMREIARYWEGVRGLYVAFESSIRSGTADVYRHEMPGGQYTNLREQARATGLDRRWNDVAQAYADVNQMFGDIVKVTPTSKVVGDLAVFMVANDLSAKDVIDPERDVAFPESVISLFKGELGFPPDGFPRELSKKILKADPPTKFRPGDLLEPVDMTQAKTGAEKAAGRKVSDADVASYLMYPKVFKDFCAHQREFGDVSTLPTETFFYGMREGEEIAAQIDEGKTLAIRMHGMASSEEDERERVFFELTDSRRTGRKDQGNPRQNRRNHRCARLIG